jgi:hypothetical protein
MFYSNVLHHKGLVESLNLQKVIGRNTPFLTSLNFQPTQNRKYCRY